MPEGEDPEGQPKVQSSQYEFLKPTERFTYGCWRTDKPKEAGYSHEMISPDAMRLVQQNSDLDTLLGEPYPGVDTLLKAFKYNVNRIPDHNYLGTKVEEDGEEKYEWKSLKEVSEDAENFSLGVKALGLCPEVEHEGKMWKFMGIKSRNRYEWYTGHLGNMHQDVTTVAFFDQ